MSDGTATEDAAAFAVKHSAIRADRAVSDGRVAIDPAAPYEIGCR
jgi:hypothetical protein